VAKIREARDEIFAQIRNKELEQISQKVERLRTEIQNTNLALERCQKRLDFLEKLTNQLVKIHEK